MLTYSYYSVQTESAKWQKKVLFHSFLSVHSKCPHSAQKEQKNILFYKIVADGLNGAWHDTREWARSTSGGRLNRRYNFLYRLPTTHMSR
jgi:hypothetical protein